MKKIFIFLFFSSCLQQNYDTNKIECIVDSVYQAPKISIQQQISNIWIFHTTCGNNLYSINPFAYKKGDTISIKQLFKTNQ